jgi:hypothetical protein
MTRLIVVFGDCQKSSYLDVLRSLDRRCCLLCDTVLGGGEVCVGVKVPNCAQTVIIDFGYFYLPT